MALMRYLASRLLRNKRSLQDELDIWRLYHVLHYYERCGGQEIRVPLPNQRVSVSKQFTAVQKAVTKQLVAKLTALSESEEPSRIMQLLPFQLSIPKHADPQAPIPGVWLDGHAVPGTIICFFPGTVYVPGHIQEMPNYPSIGQGNPHLMSRGDGSVIDAHSVCSSKSFAPNPLSVGHLVRHPDKGQQPNVMPFSYSVPPNFPPHLLPCIPNKYYKPPGFLYASGSLMRTLLFVAMKHIKNEELFLNYRLHPGSELPDWYHSVDVEEDKRRWKLNRPVLHT